MKKQKHILLIIGTLLVVLSIGCEKPGSPSSGQTTTAVSRPDVGEMEMEKSGNARYLTYETTVHIKPTFYTGSMPFSYMSVRRIISSDNDMIEAMHEFAQWKTRFAYNDVALRYSGIADAARTIDTSGRVIAEAKLFEIVKGQGFEIEEYHYNNNGDVSFYAKSFIEFTSGMKKNEIVTKGMKQTDYYFIWPVKNR